MAIDWTKPIETSDGTPSHYIGRRMDKTRVVEFGGLIFSCENDGSIHGHKSIIIRNVEPKLINIEVWAFAAEVSRTDISVHTFMTHGQAAEHAAQLRSRDGFTVGPITRIVLQILE